MKQMPWQAIEKSEEKLNFIIDWKRKEFTFSELCKRYKISRPTGYELVDRYQREGVDGLKDRPRIPLVTPHKTSETIEQILLDVKYRFPYWGPAKIKDYLLAEGIEGNWPAASTIGAIYKRH